MTEATHEMFDPHADVWIPVSPTDRRNANGERIWMWNGLELAEFGEWKVLPIESGPSKEAVARAEEAVTDEASAEGELTKVKQALDARIEAESLRDQRTAAEDRCDDYERAMREAQAECARLRAALEDIRNMQQITARLIALGLGE